MSHVQGQSVAVVGAGIAGLLTAHALVQKGVGLCRVFERAQDIKQGCSFVAGGMLSPLCELEEGHQDIYTLGMRSLEVWPGIVASLSSPVAFQCDGSCLLSYPQEYADVERLVSQIVALGHGEELQVLGREEVRALEPDVSDVFQRVVFLPREGWIDVQALLPALEKHLAEHSVTIEYERTVASLAHHGEMVLEGGEALVFDWVFDCRGLGARDVLPLRGVRGDILRVYAPDVALKRPFRLMNPRFPLYVTPRPEQRFLIGATSLETEDRSPITVESLLSLLSTAYSFHKGFASARLEEVNTHVRPTSSDHLPHVQKENRLIRLNGLYRHGYLVGPALAEEAIRRMDDAGRP